MIYAYLHFADDFCKWQLSEIVSSRLRSCSCLWFSFSCIICSSHFHSVSIRAFGAVNTVGWLIQCCVFRWWFDSWQWTKLVKCALLHCTMILLTVNSQLTRTFNPLRKRRKCIVYKHCRHGDHETDWYSLSLQVPVSHSKPIRTVSDSQDRCQTNSRRYVVRLFIHDVNKICSISIEQLWFIQSRY